MVSGVGSDGFKNLSTWTQVKGQNKISTQPYVLSWVSFVGLMGLIHIPKIGEIIQSSCGPRHLSTIPLKDSYLFKIFESVISFYL